MKIICWNIQGIKKQLVVSELKFILRKHSLDLIFQLETIVNETNLQTILPQFWYDHYDFILPINHSRELAFLWNNGRNHALVLNKEPRTIHMLAHNFENSQNTVIYRIYAPVSARGKYSFWEYLLQLHNVINVTWCLVGDFNEIASSNDNVGACLLVPSS